MQEGCRKPFLRALLQKADRDPHFKTKDAFRNEALRIEVLLWGGDEMTLIVPAWKGLETAQLFFEQSKGLSFDGAALSHRMAVVFCHHNMPGLQIRQIAEPLLDRTKNAIQTSSPREACHYLVLASFDILGASVDKFLSTYYQGASSAPLLSFGDEISKIPAAGKPLKTDLALGQALGQAVFHALPRRQARLRYDTRMALPSNGASKR